MSEARILSAFWNRRQKRFVELTALEIQTRASVPIDGADGRRLIASRMVERFKVPGLSTSHYLFRLTPVGKVTVAARNAKGTLPPHAVTRALTAKPKEASA
jgi:hypothetical protein